MTIHPQFALLFLLVDFLFFLLVDVLFFLLVDVLFFLLIDIYFFLSTVQDETDRAAEDHSVTGEGEFRFLSDLVTKYCLSYYIYLLSILYIYLLSIASVLGEVLC